MSFEEEMSHGNVGARIGRELTANNFSFSFDHRLLFCNQGRVSFSPFRILKPKLEE